MSEYEDYLIRESTEGPSFQEVHEDFVEQEPVDPNDITGDQQGEDRSFNTPEGQRFFVDAMERRNSKPQT